MAANAGTSTDPDWIEIYNSGNVDINLQNFYLTNDSSNPTKYRIPDKITIPSGGFVVFYAGSHSNQGPKHTNDKNFVSSLRSQGFLVANVNAHDAKKCSVSKKSGQIR